MAASTIQVGPRRTARPGAYGTIDPASLRRRGAGIKKLVLIGEAEGGKPVSELTDGRATLLDAATPKAVRELFRSGDLRDGGLAAFDASNDSRVGSPSQILFAKVNPATQGAYTLENASGDAVNLTSVDYGAFANKINTTLSLGTLQGYAISIAFEGSTEAGDNIGGDAAMQVTGAPSAVATACRVVTDANGLHITHDTAVPNEPVSLAHVAGETVKVSSGSAEDTKVNATVYGTDASDLPISETIQLTGTSFSAGTALFKTVTGMRLDGATVGAVSVFSASASSPNRILTEIAATTVAHVDGAVTVVSASADDTASVVISGFSPAGNAITETLQLNGTTLVTGAKSFGDVLAVRLSEATAGNVTVKSAGGATPTLFTITAGDQTAGIGIESSVYIPSDPNAFDGVQTFAVNTPGAGKFYVVRGRNQAGATTSEVIDMTTSPTVSVTSWSRIDQIELALVTGSVPNSFSGKVIDIASTENLTDTGASISALVNYSADVLADASDSFLLSQLDWDDQAITNSATADLLSDLEAIVAWINENSALITAEKASGAGAPPSVGGPFYLIGGSEGTATQSHWQAALDALQGRRDIIVAVMSTDAAVHAAWVSHARFMEGAGNDERNGYVPISISRTKSQLKTDIRSLNDRNTSAVAQSVDRYNEVGTRTTYGPEILAAMAGAMQAGTSVGEPLTWKLINVLGYGQDASWNPDEDADEMIRDVGLMFLSTDDELGPRWERSITTWRSDDNPIFSEMSANESANESVRRLRRNMNLQIGEKAFDGKAATLKSLAESELDLQVAEGIIKAYDSVAVTDAGDTFVIEYELAPIEPTNFILITASLNRIPSSAA